MPSEITAAFVTATIDAVRCVAAEEILPRFRRVDATLKEDGSPVTEADLAAQDALVRRLRAIDPVPVIGEEMAAREQHAVFDRGGRFWCVDPLDGTGNFSRGIPFFAISVALMDRDRPVFGVVHDPLRDESFAAARGGGATINGRALVLPGTGPVLRDAVAEVSLRIDIKALRAPLKQRKPYRRRLTSGSAALSWCDLAAARVDVILSGGQKMWDYAAGALVVEEAGGFVCAVERDDFWSAPVWKRSAIAARTQPLLEEWKAWVRTELRDAQ